MDIEDMDDAALSLPEIDSETTSNSSPGHGSFYFSDSEEEEGFDGGDNDGALSFGYGSLRSTGFRVSSERGQWKNDPMALKPTATSNLPARMRHSLPTLSHPPPEKPSLSQRPVSEPLPQTTSEKQFMAVETEYDQSDMAQLPADEAGPANTQSHHPSSPLAQERPITPEPSFVPEYSSPLPPSSPLLSPMSGCVSAMSRSVSPLSLPPSSPVMGPSSSTSEVCALLSSNEEASNDDSIDVSNSPSDDSSSPNDDPSAMPVEETVPHAITPSDVLSAALPQSVRGLQTEVEQPSSSEKPSPSALDAGTTADAIPSNTAADQAPRLTSPAPSSPQQRSTSPNENEGRRKDTGKPKPKPKAKEVGEALKDQDENTVDSSSSQPAEKKSSLSKSKALKAAKRKADSLEEPLPDVPPKKRKQVNAVASSSSSNAEPANPEDSEDDDLPQPEHEEAQSSKGRKKRAGKGSARMSKKEKDAQLFALESPQKGDSNEYTPEEGDSEIEGMIIECMATSRASSMPVSLLTRSVLQAHPNLKGQRTEKEWRKVLCRVLVNGTAARGSGIFGKVDSSGKDDSDRPLEAQWFYVPELDEDQDRATLIKSMMPRPGKRSVTKQYKQYYWRPLEKISKWDPEDDL
ncbi:hypothetical protein EST38_g12921 [Candolleomyces aberdarensis]|uniref:Uncharacterized protein n=1 Tax=Candolleomyces aberdarensis TaxID=2316362 RepID=A0A4Q2D192_9AGAR|nr:hypothetical protein EST38_g12921 [Candolleomyces aberdarensis]